MSEVGEFKLGDFELQCGRVLPDAKLSMPYGTLAADRSNVILYPTSYGAQHTDIDWLIGKDRVLDPTRYFIVIPNMFTNGLSTSPSNCVPMLGGGRWRATRMSITCGRSDSCYASTSRWKRWRWCMAGPWAHNRRCIGVPCIRMKVARICALCGTARTSPHNLVFIEGVKAALKGDPSWRDGYFAAHPAEGLRAMGRVYAGWAMSQAFYRESLWSAFGATSVEDYLVRFWEGNFLRRDSNDLLAQFRTWELSDISNNNVFHGDLSAALGAIKAHTALMPGARICTSHRKILKPNVRRSRERATYRWNPSTGIAPATLPTIRKTKRPYAPWLTTVAGIIPSCCRTTRTPMPTICCEKRVRCFERRGSLPAAQASCRSPAMQYPPPSVVRQYCWYATRTTASARLPTCVHTAERGCSESRVPA